MENQTNQNNQNNQNTTENKQVAEISISDKGYVSTLGGLAQENRKRILTGEAGMAIQLLEDGLSYLNYAELGSDMGMQDKEKDHAIGMGFIYDALQSLINKVELDQEAVYTPRVRRPRPTESNRPTKEERKNRTNKGLTDEN